MPLDAICLRAVCEEINSQIAGGRIDKIYQPERDEIVLSIRIGGTAKRLLLNIGASAPRMHFIDGSRENPAAPPMFCMLLRKHLQGAKVNCVTQPGLERMALLEFDTTDEMGVPSKKTLAAELMGKYSNLILYDAENRIIDAIRRVDLDISAKRQVLPGLFYHMPPPQNKIDPFTVSAAGLLAAIGQAAPDMPADKWILSSFQGFSPLICREIVYHATGFTDKPLGALTDAELKKLSECFINWLQQVISQQWQPTMLIKTEDKTVFDFSYLPVTQYENLVLLQGESSFSNLLSRFYEKKGAAERIRRKSADITHIVVLARDRLSRKIAMQQQELAKTHDRERYKRQGDLIIANLYQLEKGMNRVKVIDYFDETCPEVEITLDISLTPQQNAQRCFKQYNKAQTAEKMLTEQIDKGGQELEYLESVLESMQEAECEADLEQIRQELLQSGYLSEKQHKGKKKSAKVSASAPFSYRTSDGFSVFAGRNNTQNDLLTHKTAFKSDIWFHTQKIHGSHVILVCDGKTPTDTAMTEAAEIAAWHSQARGSSQIPVDYTPVRHVKKPGGGKPGFVIYHVYQTAHVTPDEEKIKKLRVK